MATRLPGQEQRSQTQAKWLPAFQPKFWLLIGVSAALGVGTAAYLFDFSERPISKRPLPG
jgi:hypothetical protein